MVHSEIHTHSPLYTQEKGQEVEWNEFDEFQEMGLQYLEELGLIERDGENIIVDVSKLKESNAVLIPSRSDTHLHKILQPHVSESLGKKIDRNQTRVALKSFEPFQAYVGTHWNEFLYNVFRGKKVYTVEDYEREEGAEKKGGKPLFYAPRSKEAAFDPDAIRAADFYLGPWELQGAKSEHYSADAQFSNFDQVALAAVIFHPAYGDGQRDKSGRLLVRYSDGTRRPISVEWLAEQKKANRTTGATSKQRGGLFVTPYTALQSPDLSDLATLVHPEDFKFTSRNEQSDLYTERRPINPKGYVMFRGIRYTLGAEYGGKPGTTQKGGRYEACVVSEKTGGILAVAESGDMTLVATFPLLAPDAPGLKTVATKTSHYKEAGKNMVPVQKLDSPQHIFSLEHNTEKSFDTRAFLQYKEAFAKETKISLNALTPLEQSTFVHYYQSVSDQKREQLKKFAARYRADGLKTFLVAALEDSHADTIFKIDDTFQENEARAIFKKFQAFSAHAQNVDVDLRESLTDSAHSAADEIDKPRVTEEIVRRGVKLLEEFANGTKKHDSEDVVRQLEDVDVDLQIFAGTFKVFSKEHPIDITMFRNTEIFSESATAFSEKEKVTMRDIFIQNRKGYPAELLTRTVQDFDTVLSDSSKKFFILRVNKKMAAFIRFDKIDSNRLYAGSLNVRPEMRGAAIGSAFFKATLDRAAQSHNVEADVYEKNPMLKHYIEDFGFQVVGEDPNYHGTGQRFIKIERPAVQSHPGRAAA